MTPAAAPAHASPRHVSGRAVILTGAAVIVLWAASFALSYAALGAASLPIALAIAVAKAVLVALYFMELVRARLSVRLTVISALALLFTLIAFMVADIATRDRPPLVPAAAPLDGPRAHMAYPATPRALIRLVTKRSHRAACV